MKTIVFYFLQVFLCSGLLYSYYLAFLKNRRLHGFNRVFLLSSFLISLVAPLIKVPYYVSLTKEAGTGLKALVKYNELLLPEVAITTSGKQLPGWGQLLFLAYFIIAILLVLKILAAVFNLFKKHSQSASQKWQRFTVIETKDPSAPYSFFNWLFWNPDIDDKTERGKKILQHEVCHMQQLHSLDIMISELFTAMAWVNPFFWLIKKELKAVHEFSADAFACRNTGPLVYAEILISEALLLKRNTLVNPFFNNQFKRRIAMLTSKHQNSFLRKWMVLPLWIITGGLFMISCQSKDKMSAVPEVFKKVEKEANYPGNWARYLQENLHGEVPVDRGAPTGNYPVLVQFIVDTDGNVSDLKVIKDPGFGTAEEAVRVIRASGKWQPAMMNGKAVKAFRKQPITFQITEG